MKSKPLIIAIAGALVLALVGVAVFFFVSTRNANPAVKLQSSQVGSSLDSLTTVNGIQPASTMVAPATDAWWQMLIIHSTNVHLKSLPFEKISANAKYVAYTLSAGDKFQLFNTVGMPTNYIVYENEEAAVLAAEILNLDGGYSFQQVGNFIMFGTPGSMSDVDFVLKSFEESKNFVADKGFLTGGKALTVFSFANFFEIVDEKLD
jgi:hypothetical protein